MFMLFLIVFDKDTVSSLWMDGDVSAQLASRMLAGGVFSKRCIVIGRDSCHELMIDLKLPAKTKPMWMSLRHHWFETPDSFMTKTTHSDRARQNMMACQQTATSTGRRLPLDQHLIQLTHLSCS